jgi:hypothetical protein
MPRRQRVEVHEGQGRALEALENWLQWKRHRGYGTRGSQVNLTYRQPVHDLLAGHHDLPRVAQAIQVSHFERKIW